MIPVGLGILAKPLTFLEFTMQISTDTPAVFLKSYNQTAVKIIAVIALSEKTDHAKELPSHPMKWPLLLFQQKIDD